MPPSGRYHELEGKGWAEGLLAAYGNKMAYEEFAYWYDELNQAADFDGLARRLHALLVENGMQQGIVADLGCGTGEVTLRLAQLGYDMIGIDRSPEMLCILREKAEQQGIGKLLLLQQDLTQLDLYGTIHGAVSTFDTFNHLTKPQLSKAFERVYLFMEPGGVLLFDANTSYKHTQILGNNSFEFEDPEEEFFCQWNNQYLADKQATQIHIIARQGKDVLFEESFLEYNYSLEFWEELLENVGFSFVSVQDGEIFAPLTSESQRYLFTAIKPKDAKMMP